MFPVNWPISESQGQLTSCKLTQLINVCRSVYSSTLKVKVFYLFIFSFLLSGLITANVSWVFISFYTISLYCVLGLHKTTINSYISQLKWKHDCTLRYSSRNSSFSWHAEEPILLSLIWVNMCLRNRGRLSNRFSHFLQSALCSSAQSEWENPVREGGGGRADTHLEKSLAFHFL